MIENWLLLPQILIYLLGRLLDDMSWYDVGVKNQVLIFQGVGVACMATCVIIQILRKRHIDGWWRILFVRSQAKFIISWALIITIGILFFNIFGCHSTVPQGQQAYLYVVYTVCCVNVTQLALTNFNYSLICNTKAHIIELIVYQAVLFGEVIYNGHLLMLMIGKLQEKQKDYAILLISIEIANQILIMDLMFRAAYQDREREEEKEEKMLGHIIRSHVNTLFQGHEKQDGFIVPSMQEISNTANIAFPEKTKK